MSGTVSRPVRARRSGRVVRGGLTLCDCINSGCDCINSACLVYEFDLCAGIKKHTPNSNYQIKVSSPYIHTTAARKVISHPEESSEFVPIICNGWAARSVITPDGHRQILSFLLPGDLISAVNLFAPMSGHFVDAITAVTCRKFKQAELKAALFECPALLEKLCKIWIDERAHADQLAVNISYKKAEKRIAWLILNLAKRLTKREVFDDQRLDFPLRQQHIANATGLTHAYVCKVLGDFQRAGLIEISNHLLRIIDNQSLRAVASWR